MLVVWLICTFWINTISEDISKKVELDEQIELISEEDYLYMNLQMYNHLIGDECQCSGCMEDMKVDEGEYEDEDEWEDEEDIE